MTCSLYMSTVKSSLFVGGSMSVDFVGFPYPCVDLEGGSGGSGPPLEFAKLNIADITGNEKN